MIGDSPISFSQDYIYVGDLSFQKSDPSHTNEIISII